MFCFCFGELYIIKGIYILINIVYAAYNFSTNVKLYKHSELATTLLYTTSMLNRFL